MARPRKISDEAILQAARELFLEQGFSVTTALIARRAGISEGSIFKRWPTKHELFLAALGMEGHADPLEGLEQLAGTGSLRENLVGVTRRLIAFFQELIPRVMVLCGHGAMPSPDRGFFKGSQNPHGQMHRKLVRYLELEMAGGRLRPGDARVAARILGAAVWNFVFFSHLDADVYHPMKPEEYAQKLVETLCTGISLEDGPGPAVPASATGKRKGKDKGPNHE